MIDLLSANHTETNFSICVVQITFVWFFAFLQEATTCSIIIKFSYNARSDWLKVRALSENRARVDDGKLAFKFLLRNFDKFDPN